MNDAPIFISYRREDVRADAGKMAEVLGWAFGAERVFFDRKSIMPGTRWPERLRAGVGAARVCVVVMGRAWLGAVDAAGVRRLEDEEDWVRHEVRTALDNDQCMVVPVLVDGVEPLSRDDLPEDLMKLTECQARRVRELPDFEHDLLTVVRVIAMTLGLTPKPFLFEERRRQMEKVLKGRAGENRREMLAKVREAGVDGLLAKSMQGVVSFSLGLEFAPQAVVSARGLPDAALRDSRDIGEVFFEWERQLLILGMPGGGKTILLLQLAQRLLDAAEADARAPIPVVLNLSSWSTKRLPLRTWLEEALRTAYQVPLRMGREWVEGQRLLLLLDGLDEVGAQVPADAEGGAEWLQGERSAAVRRECVAAINAFLVDFPKCPLAVCSRVRDYDEMGARLNVRAAVTLQPLDLERALSFVAGPEYLGLREVASGEAGLREMLTVPFLLNLARIAYRGRTTATLMLVPLAGGDARQAMARRRDDLIETYIETQLTEAAERAEGADALFVRRLVRVWLAFLAWQMRERKQSVFYIEQLQHEWLNNAVTRMGHVVAATLIFGTLAGLLVGLFFNLSDLLTPATGGSTASAEALEMICHLAMMGELMFLLGALGQMTHGSMRAYGWEGAGEVKLVAAVLCTSVIWAGSLVIIIPFQLVVAEGWFGALMMIVGGPFFFTSIALLWIFLSWGMHSAMRRVRGWRAWMATPSLAALLICLVMIWGTDGAHSKLGYALYFIVAVLSSVPSIHVKVVDRLSWRWSWLGTAFGGLAGGMIALLYLNEYFHSNPMPYFMGSMIVSVGCFMGGALGGFSKSEKLSARSFPGSGLRQTMRNGLILCISFLCVGAAANLITPMSAFVRSGFHLDVLVTMVKDTQDTLFSLAGLGLTLGLVVSGLDGLLKHWILRAQLWCGGWLPFRLVRFWIMGRSACCCVGWGRVTFFCTGICWSIWRSGGRREVGWRRSDRPTSDIAC